MLKHRMVGLVLSAVVIASSVAGAVASPMVAKGISPAPGRSLRIEQVDWYWDHYYPYQWNEYRHWNPYHHWNNYYHWHRRWYGHRWHYR